MTNAELLAKFKSEIERLKATNPSEYAYQNAEGYIWALDDVLSFISTLESEKPMNQDEDLNEEIKKFVAEYGYERSEDILLIATVARHFAEWQKEQDEKEQADLFTIVALDAAQRAREQMMKVAVNGWLDEDNEPPYDLNVVCEEKIPFGKFKHGDKVKIIIVKED